MNGERPDPDALLARVQDEAARARRGRLKIFFGACAGVGKTYAMLSAARDAQTQGKNVVIGYIEPHGRRDTEALLQGLPWLALRKIAHRDRTLQEFDPDAALAWAAAHPQALVLIDELAHTNAPDSRHPKRWQDVEELLAAGIDVWTTVNVQHLESLNDIVSGITQVKVWEKVPDHVFDRADEVVVVDLPPDELLLRLKQGKVYMPQQAEQAMKNFFRKGNLLALRELALRRTADRVDGQMQAFRREHQAIATVWPNRESLLACIGPDDHAEQIVHKCARLASQLEVHWHAVHVETPALQRLSQARQDRILKALNLAQELGATTATLAAPDPASALIRYARANNLARLVLGRPAQQRRWPWQPRLSKAIQTRAPDLDVMLVAERSDASSRIARTETQTERQPIAWRGYIAAVLVCSAVTLLATPLADTFELTNIVMLFLLAVLGVGLRYGRGPAIVAAFVGVGCFDFFFVPPRFNFAVSDAQYLLTFAVMLLVALVIGQLTAGLKVQAEAATEREQRMRSLYEMSRDLSAALLPLQVAEIGGKFLQREFQAGSTLLVADDNGQLQVMPGGTAAVDQAVAQWSFDHGQPAGLGTDTLPAGTCLVLPLKATMRLRGVIAVAPGSGLLHPEQRRLLDTCASLLAISLERIHYIDVAQSTTVQMESERLRNSLLTAISHDLRTPLASLVGLADTLQLGSVPEGEQKQIVQSIRKSALHMSALVNNLLDMARLEAGKVQLNKQWQPLEEVIGSALAQCNQILAGRAVTVKLADDLPLLQLDAVLMERVLVNLLENAAKYTPAGTAIAIAAHVDGDNVVVTLDDHGPGLPPGREQAIFEKFERGQKEPATAGVGLGLAICRAIVRVHGGSIRGETRLEGGARFTLVLPRGKPPSDDGSAAGATMT
ncbi:MAG TPA: DUF4118 domain-containing protein [Candidatus Acidoferrum sp.]|nr:DUF4118 domain-containing protein [Candidatus Acidoferrum sp.]